MARRGRRYDNEKKLNYKKVFAVLVLFIVIIMFIVGIKKLFTTGITSSGKITSVSYFPVYSNGKWGVINSNGDTIIEPQYEEMPVIPNNSQAVFICTYDINYETGEHKTKVINEKNDSIITGYDEVKFIDYVNKNDKLCFVENVLMVEKDGKFGLVDFKNKKLLDVDYDQILILNGVENSLIIKKGDNVGLCDYEGNIIINAEYKEIKAIGDNYKNGYIVVNKQGLYGIIDFNKSVIFENKYLDIKPIYSSNKYAVKIDDGYRVIDKNGQILLDKKFTDIKDINSENIIYKENKKYGITTTYLENKVEAKYEDLTFMGNNYYIAKNGQSYGIISENGEVKVEFKYISITHPETAGIAIAETSEHKYDIYDSNLELKLTVNQIEVKDEYMKTIIGEELKYYNFKFEEKDSRTIFSTNDIFSDKKDGKYGFVSASGSVIVEHQYDEVTELNKYGYAGIKQNGLWGVINAKGKVILEPKYNLDNNDIIDFIGKWHKGVGADYYTDI